MVVEPASTDPMREMDFKSKRMASASVVFPQVPWPIKAMFLSLSVGYSFTSTSCLPPSSDRGSGEAGPRVRGAGGCRRRGHSRRRRRRVAEAGSADTAGEPPRGQPDFVSNNQKAPMGPRLRRRKSLSPLLITVKEADAPQSHPAQGDGRVVFLAFPPPRGLCCSSICHPLQSRLPDPEEGDVIDGMQLASWWVTWWSTTSREGWKATPTPSPSRTTSRSRWSRGTASSC